MFVAEGFKTGGREKGTPNRATSDMRREIAESGEMPLEYIVRVMRDETVEQSRRDHMAKAAAPYLHPRLSVVEHNDETNTQYVMALPRQCATIEEWQAMVKQELQQEARQVLPSPDKANGQ
jgi:hypothetical protein